MALKLRPEDGQEPVLQSEAGTVVASRVPVWTEKEAACFLNEGRQIGRKLNWFQELNKVLSQWSKKVEQERQIWQNHTKISGNLIFP